MSEEVEKPCRTIGIWMSEKKFQKLRWSELVSVCKSRGYDIVKLDLERPLEEQGNLTVFIHKLTDIIAAADQNDAKSEEIIKRVNQFISNHPDMLVIDPLHNVRILLDRYRYYSLIETLSSLRSHNVFTPAFCVFPTQSSLEDWASQLPQRGVTFPLVCKPILAHGSKLAHSMCVVFNQQGLSHCKTPCVVQSFINHNAVLFKVFVVGNSYFITERPSLKNFYACDEREPIYFHSGDVCKADSQSTLSILDPHEIENIEQKKTQLDTVRVEAVINTLRMELNLILFGIDIVVDNASDRYAIIDINIYPGYDNFPNFFEHLINNVDSLVNLKVRQKDCVISNSLDDNNENCFKSNVISNSLNHAFEREQLLNVESVYSKNVLKNIN